MEVFNIENLSFAYPEQTEKALDGVSLSVRKGEFLVLCGASGCGKSTLLRNLKTALAPHGTKGGSVMFCGRQLNDVDLRTQSAKIGFVLQSPDNQIVTDKVWHELAFGLESLGLDTQVIRRRAAEMAAFFGIEDWFYKNVSELSGGQKQLLNLASVMAMQPEVLILDEPTSQLDPIAAGDFLAVLGRINRQLGTSVLLTEQRLEEALPLADRCAVMDKGKIICCGDVKTVGRALKGMEHTMFDAMPAAMRIWAGLETNSDCPVTVSEGRAFLSEYAEHHEIFHVPEKTAKPAGETVISAKQMWFRYEKDGRDIIKGLDLTVQRGEMVAILGGNGAGKSTTLKLLCGALTPYRGKLQTHGRVSMLPQDPQTLFVKKTVYEDLYAVSKNDEKVRNIAALCCLTELLDRHPYDLSGGQQQRAALAMILLQEPDVLLLDEPTKGLDAHFKRLLAKILGRLTQSGVSVVTVTHDLEFAAAYADRCALFFDGSIVSQGTPTRFFSDNSFYTSSANRISRGIVADAVTAENVILACGGTLPPEPELPDVPEYTRTVEPSPGKKAEPLPTYRKIIALLSLASALAIFVYAVRTVDLSALVNATGVTKLGIDSVKIYAALIASLLVFMLAIGRRSPPPVTVQTSESRRRLTKRTAAAALLVLVFVPLTLFFGVYYLDKKQYYITATLVLIECMLPFFMIFEGRRPQARELVIIAVLCAIAVAGRAAFFMLPQFKPVLALTIIAGIAFGGETGFLVGAMTMLASNVLFSQGPWTPWQMFAMGISGFLAGVLFRKGLLRRTRSSMCVFGALCAIVVYGGIMNPASVLLWGGGSINAKMILTYYITGFPMDCIHAFATVFFLYIAAEPMLEKLDRIKVKYGLVE